MERTANGFMKRLLDVTVAVFTLVLTSPLMVVAALGIKLTSPGPIFFRAPRIGRDRRRLLSGMSAPLQERRRQGGYFGREFTMLKFRTMHVGGAGSASPITGPNDPRVFRFGAWLRATKVDELPQLINVLKGDMTVVGPRPEAPEIVRRHYTSDDLATLQVRPGVTSPGTVYYYTHCESTLAADGLVDDYVGRLLPAKLALDRVYISRASVFYDIRLIVRTIAGIIVRALGIRRFPNPPELAKIAAIEQRHSVSGNTEYRFQHQKVARIASGDANCRSAK
jgi:lipopolysaccharide/colanic/teichoic acid biosynthesis glycosyltransferase